MTWEWQQLQHYRRIYGTFTAVAEGGEGLCFAGRDCHKRKPQRQQGIEAVKRKTALHLTWFLLF